ncbi:MAG: hypothetical protein QOK09_2624 [Mycobacterium sp.]|nr:hypothetical protein [Mycobacterium sp.]
MGCQAVALRILAHFVPGPRVLDFLAPESDWLDIYWCADDDSAESQATFYRELPEADVIWHVLRPLSGADLSRATRLRLVHKFGAGVNTIDVDTATKHGIAVANMPGANAPSVAEGTVLLMLATLRRLPALDRATREGRGWPSDPQLGETVRDIGACTVGLVGYGNVAKHVARIVAAMGATVLHTSTRDDGLPGWRPLSELLAGCDIVSLHLPLTHSTHGLLGEAAQARMKRLRYWSTPHAARLSTKTPWSPRCATAGWRLPAWMSSRPSRCCRTTRCSAWTTSCSHRTSPGTPSTPCGAG